VGSLSYLRAVEIGAGFYIPSETVVGKQELARFQKALLTDAPQIMTRMVQREQITYSGQWHGALLLLRFLPG